jgi:hypothetical protein
MMTINKLQPGTADTGPSREKAQKTEKTQDDETEDEKIKREQATNPALMPIGDPAGAA